MSSLRLALKQSLEEAAPIPTKDELRAKQRSKRGRKRKRKLLLKEKLENDRLDPTNRNILNENPDGNSLELIRRVKSVSPVGGINGGKGSKSGRSIQSGHRSNSSSSESDSDDGSSSDSSGDSSSSDGSDSDSDGSSSSDSGSSSDSDDDGSGDKRRSKEDMAGVFDSERSSDEDGNGPKKNGKPSSHSSANHFKSSDHSASNSDDSATHHPSERHELIKKLTQNISATNLLSRPRSQSPLHAQMHSSQSDPGRHLSASLSSSHIPIQRSLPSSTLSNSSSKKEKRSISSSSTKKKRKAKKGKPKAVPAPTQQVLAWVMGMSPDKQRRKITPGMRVKVRFVNPTLQWYGGVITAVAPKGDKVKIKYDDGTKESASFPDREIVIDADGNGEHSPKVEDRVKAFRPKVIGITLGAVPLNVKKKKTKKKKKDRDRRDGHNLKTDNKQNVKREIRRDMLPNDGVTPPSSNAISSINAANSTGAAKEERNAKAAENETTNCIVKDTNIVGEFGAADIVTEVFSSPIATVLPQTLLTTTETVYKPASTCSAVAGNNEQQIQSDSEIALEPIVIKSNSGQDPTTRKQSVEDICNTNFRSRSSSPIPKKESTIGSYRAALDNVKASRLDDYAADVLEQNTIFTEPAESNDPFQEALAINTAFGTVSQPDSAAIESTPVEKQEMPIEAENHTLEKKESSVSSKPSDDTTHNGDDPTHDRASDNEGKISITENESMSDDDMKSTKAGLKAHQRIASNEERVIGETRGKKRRKDKEDVRRGKKSDSKEDVEDWVQCDICSKWRLIPSVKDLPEKWYCQLNVTDPKRSFCAAVEQTPKEVARERKKAKNAAAKKLGGRRSVSPAAVPRRNSSQKLKEGSDHGSDKRRNSPSLDKSMSEDSVDDFQSSTKKKIIASNPSMEDEDSDNEVVVPQPRRGRRGRRSNEEKGEGRQGRRGKKQKEDKQQEWVQCEKCEKWRRLPRHISAEDLPDKWYCSLNDWDPRSASCAVQEDYKIEDEKGKENTILTSNGQVGAVGGSKLSYKCLIRRPTRNITERMRATESIFSSHAAEADGEQSGAQAVVLYANSSMFLKRPNYHRMADQHEPDNVQKVLLFDLMNQSQLWKDLYCGLSPIAVDSYDESFDPLTNTDQGKSAVVETMKVMLFYTFGVKHMSASDILLDCQCREWENKYWIELSASFTYELVCALIDQLIKDGLLEVAPQTSSEPENSLTATLFKRTGAPDDASRGQKKRKEMENRYASRSMKFSKPWKIANNQNETS